MRTPSLKILLGAAGLLVIAGGCSTGFYKKWADQQVDQIVQQREDVTLGYKPDVEAETTVNPKPAPQAYAKVPLSPKPPPTTSPIESSDLKVPYGPLGPDMLFPSGVTAPAADESSSNSAYGQDAAEVSAADHLALGPPAPQKLPVQLDLFGSIRYAVEHSRDYKSHMENLYLAALDVTLERHLFEPRPFASTGLHYLGGQENVDYAAAMTAVNTIGVKQQLPYGGNIAAQTSVDFVRAISGNAENGETATVALTASIPLLRGAGMVNLEPLIQTERTMVYDIRAFEDYRRSFAVNIASQYFQLLTSQQAVSDRLGNLASFQNLTARSEALAAAGKQSYIDVQRSLQSQLQAEQDLINAQATYRAAKDNYKLALGMPVDQRLDVLAQELTVNVPKFSENEVATLAQKYRLDLRTASDQVEDAQRGVEVAKNGLLPDLNITAGGNFGNPPIAPAVGLNNDFTTYSANIDLEIPLDRVAERNNYRRSLITLERSSRSYQQLNDQIAADARNAMRLIRSAEVSLDIQRKGIELAKLRLDYSIERMRQGKADNRDVVDAQNSLLQAQDAYEQANATLQIQVLQFLQSTGTLRVDPSGGEIGQAMDRRLVAETEAKPQQ